MNSSSLQKSFSEFSYDEAKTHVRRIRDLRRQYNEKIVKKKNQKKGQKKQKQELLLDLDNMKPSEKKALLKKLLKIKEAKNGKTCN